MSFQEMSFEYFEHKADIGVRGKGETLKEAFEQIALATFEIMIETKDLHSSIPKQIEISGNDYEELLMAWLSELLYLKDVENQMYYNFEIIELTEQKLSALIYGEIINPEEHKLKLEVKAATWTQLAVKKEKKFWIAQCVVDV